MRRAASSVPDLVGSTAIVHAEYSLLMGQFDDCRKLVSLGQSGSLAPRASLEEPMRIAPCRLDQIRANLFGRMFRKHDRRTLKQPGDYPICLLQQVSDNDPLEDKSERVRGSFQDSTATRSNQSASRNRSRNHVVLPVPRGPNRKNERSGAVGRRRNIASNFTVFMLA